MNGVYAYNSQENAEMEFDFIRTDLQGFIDYRISPLSRFALGYQYRILDVGNNSHRIIQQFSVIQILSGLRLSHRVRADQTFFRQRNTEFRIRYRINAEFPLQGRSIDNKEFYLIISAEPIFSVQGSETDIEGRLVGSVGYLFNRNNKLQLGPDYRIDRLLTEGLRQQIWLKIGWYLSI